MLQRQIITDKRKSEIHKALGKIGCWAGKVNKEESMKFVITIEQDEDGMFISECPSIPGCISQGKTEQEALENIEDAIKQCLEVRVEKRMPLTVATREVEVLV